MPKPFSTSICLTCFQEILQALPELGLPLIVIQSDGNKSSDQYSGLTVGESLEPDFRVWCLHRGHSAGIRILERMEMR